MGDNILMEYFEKFCSNTYAGSGNQHCFYMEESKIRTGRVLYKITDGGEYNYSLLFSNIIDSTYNDGEISHNNLICDSWTIHSAKIGKCEAFDSSKDVLELTMNDENKYADIRPFDFKPLTFNGKTSKEVMPGEFFVSDPVKCKFEKNEYLCLEITFSGKMIPYHEETLLPVFMKENEEWKYSKFMPLAGMVGCDRSVKGKIAYLGDSITQGIGTKANSYLHWNAVLSEKLGSDYSYWNLGLGYGRASDAASDGAWLYKAKQNDIIFVCYGVNDILKGHTEEQIKNAGYKEVVQDETIPEYDENTHYLEQRYIDGDVITIGYVAVEYVLPEEIMEGEL